MCRDAYKRCYPDVQDANIPFDMIRFHGYDELIQEPDIISQDNVNTYHEQTGNTLLHIACQKHDKSIIDMLLDYGADKEADNYRGLRPIEMIFEYEGASPSFLDIVQHMIDKNVCIRPCILHKSVTSQSIETVQYLLQEIGISGDAYCNRIDCGSCHSTSKGICTPLHTLASMPLGPQEQEPVDMVTLLLKNGASLDAHNGIYTPLALAIYFRKMRILWLLIARGADVNAWINGDIAITPIYIAAGMGSRMLVTLLIAHGASPWVRGAHENTPYAYSNDSVCRYILSTVVSQLTSDNPCHDTLHLNTISRRQKLDYARMAYGRGCPVNAATMLHKLNYHEGKKCHMRDTLDSMYASDEVDDWIYEAAWHIFYHTVDKHKITREIFQGDYTDITVVVPGSSYH